MDTEAVKKHAPRFYVGLISFAAVLLFLIFAAAPLRRALGTGGLLITETFSLVCGILPIFIFRYDIREVLPIKRPGLRQLLGVLLLLLAVVFAGYLHTAVLILVAPKAAAELTRALDGILSGAPFLVSLVVSALMPAVCEETLCRGFIQYAFGGLKRRWLVVLLVGVLFGTLHLSLLRFIPSMLTGMVLAYIMAETKNLVLPVTLHFLNNAAAPFVPYILIPFATQVKVRPLPNTPILNLGIILLYCAAIPWLLLMGARLLRAKADNARSRLKRGQLAAVGIVSVCLIAAGLTALSVGSGMKVAELSFTKSVSAETAAETYPLVIRKDCDYLVNYTVMREVSAKGRTALTLKDAQGQECLSITSDGIPVNAQSYLTAGDYTLTFKYRYENTAPATVTVDLVIMRLQPRVSSY